MDIKQEELIPEEDEEFTSECNARATAIINSLVGGKYKAIMDENSRSAEVLRNAVSFQAQYMIFRPELLNDDCETVSVYVMSLLYKAGLIKLDSFGLRK